MDLALRAIKQCSRLEDLQHCTNCPSAGALAGVAIEEPEQEKIEGAGTQRIVLPVLINLNWLILIRGLVLLFLPPETTVALFGRLRFEQFFYAYVAVSFIIGVYLTYGGVRQLFKDREFG
jgi:hypothetical protein